MKLKIILYLMSAIFALGIIYAGYEVYLGSNSLFDSVKEVDLREKATPTNKLLLSNVSYKDYYVERWQTTVCTTQVTEEKHLLTATTEIWFCKATEEVHDLKECTVDKEVSLCVSGEGKEFLCKEGWMRITK
jgi:hypothetical protein